MHNIRTELGASLVEQNVMQSVKILSEIIVDDLKNMDIRVIRILLASLGAVIVLLRAEVCQRRKENSTEIGSETFDIY